MSNRELSTRTYGSGWTRVLIRVSYYGDKFGVRELHTDISTPTSGAGLNYEDQKEVPPHRWIRFTEVMPSPVTTEEEPLTYPLDVAFDPGVREVPLRIDVWGDNMRAHSIMTTLRIIR